jgi:hypothetical protein
VILSTIAGVWIAQSWNGSGAEPSEQILQSTERLAEADARTGTMSRADSLQVTQIGSGIFRDHSISDNDLSWLVRRLESAPLRPSRGTYEQLHIRIAYSLVIPRPFTPCHYTSSQQLAVLDALSWLCESKDASDRRCGVIALGILDDRRAVPRLIKLEHDPDARVAKSAATSIRWIDRPSPIHPASEGSKR